MNVKDLVTKYSNDVKNSGFLGSWLLNETKYPFMTYYDENHNQIDGHFLPLYMNCVIDRESLDFMSLINTYPDSPKVEYLELLDLVKSVITSNSYKYNNLYKSTILDYNLLDNLDVNIVETITDTHGEQVQTFDKGADSTTTENGKTKTTQTLGAGETDVKNFTTTFESDDNKPTTSELTSDKARTNTEESDAFSNKVNNSARQDLTTVSEYTDTHKTERHEYGDSSLRSIASGIKEERQISFFNLYAVIYADVMNELTTTFFEF